MKRLAMVVCLSFLMVLSLAVAAETPDANETFKPWDDREIMKRLAQRCPVVEPYLIWGLEAQLADLTREQSELWKLLATSAQANGIIDPIKRDKYIQDQLDNRRKQIDQMLAGRSCSDPTVKSYVDSIGTFALYGFYEEMYAFTKINAGYCSRSSRKADYAAALRDDLARIEETVPQVAGIKTQIDGMSEEVLARRCTGALSPVPYDPLTSDLQLAFEREVDARKAKGIYTLDVPLRSDPKGVAYMALRSRQSDVTLEELGSLPVTSVCVAPFDVKAAGDGSAKVDDEGIVPLVGVDAEGRLAVELMSPVKVGVSNFQILGLGDIAIEPVAHAEIDRGPGVYFDRFTFAPLQDAEWDSLASTFTIGFKIKVPGHDLESYGGGCVYSLDTLKRLNNWASSEQGIGHVLK